MQQQQDILYDYDLEECIADIGLDKTFDLLQTQPSSVAESFKGSKLGVMLDEVGMTYSSHKSIPLLCGLSALAHPSLQIYKPTDTTVQNTHVTISLQVVSANGAFKIYKTPSGDWVFLKTALEISDNMEVEALALKVFADSLQPEQLKYVLSHKATANLIVSKHRADNSFVTLDISKYFSLDLDTNYFGQSFFNQPNALIAPALWTRVVHSGISLHQLVTALADVRHPTDRNISLHKRNMHIFMKGSAVYEKIYDKPTTQHADFKRYITPIRERFLDRFNDFIANLIGIGAPLKFAHNDLHGANILYDALSDNFVMIDYGRAVVDLKSIGFDKADIMREFNKIRSKQTLTRSLAQDPNIFYKEFEGSAMRVDLTPNSKAAAYGILMDLAGITFLTYRNLMSRLSLPQHPLVGVLPDWSITVASMSDIREYISSPRSAIELTLTYFAIILRAAFIASVLPGNLIGSNIEEDPFSVDQDDVYTIEPKSVFYVSGPPHKETYGRYRDVLDFLASKLEFYKQVYNSFVSPSKKLTQPTLDQAGGEFPLLLEDQKIMNPANMDAAKGKRRQKAQGRSPSTEDEIRRLTVTNYEYNAHVRAQHSVANKYNCQNQPTFIPYAFAITKDAALDTPTPVSKQTKINA